MTQTTEQSPSLPQTQVAVRAGASGAVAAFVRGATAAGLGLGALTVLVMVLWISSPFPDSGSGGALHTAVVLWLFAHGAELVRSDTLSGAPAPLGVVPLLLLVLPVWLVHRAAREATEPGEGRPRAPARVAVPAVAAGYLLVGGPLAVYGVRGEIAVAPVSAAVHLPLLVLVAAASGVWAAHGRPTGPLPGWLPRGVRVALARSRVALALRSACGAALVLLGGGAVVALASLVWHGTAAQESFLALAGDWSGRIALALLVLALLPNAAVWGAAYGLGPGFSLGTAATATPLAFTGTPALPELPWLAALPGRGPGMPLHWAVAAVPLVAVLLVAWWTAEAAAPRYGDPEEAWTAGGTVLTVLLAALGCGIAVAAAAALAGGPLGTGRLAEFGPVWWLTGAAAAVWTVTVATPAALAIRGWRVLRARRTAGGGSAEETPVVREPSAAPAAGEPARAQVLELELDDGDFDAYDVEPYDFLPADAWSARTPPPPAAAPGAGSAETAAPVAATREPTAEAPEPGARPRPAASAPTEPPPSSGPPLPTEPAPSAD